MTLEERLARYLDATPSIEDAAFVASSATVIGDVRLGLNSSVWYGAVVRADINSIRVGEGSNLQDGVVVHLSNENGVEVGGLVTVGHRAILHGCRVADECLIGMGATLLDGVEVGTRSIVGANSLVREGMVVPPGSLVYGAPARVVRPLTAAEQSNIRNIALKYVEVARSHRSRGGW
jgi:gamma-carbonic anhydrase